METPAQIIEALGNSRTVARNLGVASSTVESWKNRPGGIPDKHWNKLILLAQDARISGVTTRSLHAANDRQREVCE